MDGALRDHGSPPGRVIGSVGTVLLIGSQIANKLAPVVSSFMKIGALAGRLLGSTDDCLASTSADKGRSVSLGIGTQEEAEEEEEEEEKEEEEGGWGFLGFSNRRFSSNSRTGFATFPT